MGTAFTTSLCPKAHLKQTLDALANISKAVLSTPIPPSIKQYLLIYGASSEIMHTHCLMALSSSAVTFIDSTLEAICRKIQDLPKGFPIANLHAPHNELGFISLPYRQTTDQQPPTHKSEFSMTSGPSETHHKLPFTKQQLGFNRGHLNLHSMSTRDADHSALP